MSRNEARLALNILSELGGKDYFLSDFFSFDVNIGQKFEFTGSKAEVIEVISDDEAESLGYALTKIRVGDGDFASTITMTWDKVDGIDEWHFSSVS